MDDLNQPKDLTPEQMMALSAIALLTPALGGAMGGKQGALAGASAGTGAAGSALGSLAKDQKDQRDKLEAADLAAKKRKAERAEDLEDFKTKEDYKANLKPEKTPEVKTRAVTTTGPDGKPVTRIVEDKPGAEFPSYVKPEKPEKPPKDISVQERNTLQSQYDKDLGARKNRAVMESFEDAKSLVKDPSPASDQALIFAYMKALDPSSVVRETEYESAQALGGLQERAKAKLAQMAGESGLTDAQRKDILSQIRKLAQTAADRQKGVDEQFTGLAGRRGVSVEDLRFLNRPTFDEEVAGTTPSPEEAAAELERRRQAREQASKGGK